jgi:hypothetical protein
MTRLYRSVDAIERDMRSAKTGIAAPVNSLHDGPPAWVVRKVAQMRNAEEARRLERELEHARFYNDE